MMSDRGSGPPSKPDGANPNGASPNRPGLFPCVGNYSHSVNILKIFFQYLPVTCV